MRVAASGDEKKGYEKQEQVVKQVQKCDIDIRTYGI
jgi:hypothetical protein